jgi:hypothetical protein
MHISPQAMQQIAVELNMPLSEVAAGAAFIRFSPRNRAAVSISYSAIAPVSATCPENKT